MQIKMNNERLWLWLFGRSEAGRGGHWHAHTAFSNPPSPLPLPSCSSITYFNRKKNGVQMDYGRIFSVLVQCSALSVVCVEMVVLGGGGKLTGWLI